MKPFELLVTFLMVTSWLLIMGVFIALIRVLWLMAG